MPSALKQIAAERTACVSSFGRVCGAPRRAGPVAFPTYVMALLSAMPRTTSANTPNFWCIICTALSWYDSCCSAPKSARQQIGLVLEKRMHSVICIKPVPAPAKIRARFLSNTIVQRGVSTKRLEAVAAEAPPSSATSRPARSRCTLWDRIHPSPDCGRCAPWVPELRCCLPDAPLSMTRRYPRRTHARPRSGRSESYLTGSLSSSLASQPSMATWPRSAPGSQHSSFCRRSTSSPQSFASISPPAASRAERQRSRPPRKRPCV